MDAIKTYIYKHFEQIFVIIILLAVMLINHYVPNKAAFLNFYYLPIIVSGYLLGIYRTVMGAVLCVLLMGIYYAIDPSFFVSSQDNASIFLHLVVWGGFLILAGVVVGKQQEYLQTETQQVKSLNEKLSTNEQALIKANQSLQDYSDNLESKVKQRTEELEKSKESIEHLKVKVEETLYSTMDSTVAKLIIEGRLRDEKRHVSVLFSDLSGFTSYSERLNPEVVIRDLNHYLSDMEPILLNYHGHIDKYLGDGIMCEFGAPLQHEQYRLMAVVSALKMQEKLTNANYPWQMRIGIASGAAIMGLVGSKRQSYTTIGDVVNLASRLETACPKTSILIDQHTLDGVERFVETRIKHDLGQADVSIEENKEIFQNLLEQLDCTVDTSAKAELYHQLGQSHMQTMELAQAVDYFTLGLKQDPEHINLKIAYADASIKHDEYCKIKVKGREQRVSAYEVIGFKNPLLDSDRIPSFCYKKYQYIEVKINELPESEIMHVEVLDAALGKSKCVAFLAYAIACELNGFSENEKLEILMAAYFLDLGKEIIAPYLLNHSTSTLTTSEFNSYQSYTKESTRILRKMGYTSESMLNIIYHCNEYYNGSGSPDGLKGEEIPIGSRIISVVSSYIIQTSWRPYRDAWKQSAAFDELEIRANQGQSDPAVVECLIQFLSQE